MGSILSPHQKPIVPRNLRKLKPGYDWQQYVAHTVVIISRADLKAWYGDSLANMKLAYEKWTDSVKAVIHNRAHDQGLEIVGIAAQLIETPNESKLVEKTLWVMKDAVAAFSAWAVLLGPVLASQVAPDPLPIFGFWPRENEMSQLVPTTVDARKLTAMEQASEG